MSDKQSVVIASDHAGLELKTYLIQNLPEIQWEDLGPSSSESVDYPDYADRLAREVVRGKKFGVVICGSGQGMAIRANRHLEIRAALCRNEEITKLSREHNDANVIALGARVTPLEDCKKLVRLFLATPFAGGRHVTRVQKLGLPPK